MTRRTRHALLTVGLAAALLAMPQVAHASSTLYPPSDACRVTPATTTPASTVVFSCNEGTFGSDEAVKITVTGENGSGVVFGFVRTAIDTGSYTSRSGAAGELGGVTIALPSDANGVYNIAAVSPSSAGGTASVTVTAGGDSTIPTTGGDSTQVALWAGGGLVLLAGGAIAVAAAARRRRAE